MSKLMVERVALSLTSDDLRLLQHACALDKVIASGWSSQGENLGCVAFWAKYTGDKARIRELYRLSANVVVGQARRKKRGGSIDDLTHLAFASVSYWLNDVCRECSGRGVIVPEKAQIDTGEVCGACQGSGKGLPPKAADVGSEFHEDRFDRMVGELLSTLDNSMSSYVTGVIHSLRAQERVDKIELKG